MILNVGYVTLAKLFHVDIRIFVTLLLTLNMWKDMHALDTRNADMLQQEQGE